MPDLFGVQKDIAAIGSTAASLESQANKDLGALLQTALTALNTVVGESLADLTAERTEAVNQLFDGTHALLDRLNGTALVMGPNGFTLQVPPRAEKE